MDLRLRMKPHPATPGVLHEAVVVEVGGEIDLHSAPRLREGLSRALESSAPPRVIVDLAGVSFIDSTGIGVLVGALKRARESKGELAFCSAQSRVKRVFEITGLLPVLPIYESRISAAKALSATITASFVDESRARDTSVDERNGDQRFVDEARVDERSVDESRVDEARVDESHARVSAPDSHSNAAPRAGETDA